MAAGYGLPAGIEAHILHYATEMRNHGFDTKVVVFFELPKPKHRFLVALEERSIPVVSLESLAMFRARVEMIALFLPWFTYMLLAKRRWPDFSSFKLWVLGDAEIGELRRRLARDKPDIIHIFGRLSTHAWALFPPDRTIFHEMMTGTVDQYWTEDELTDFRAFAENIARYFTPGSGVAENVRREFGIKRHIDMIFTMAPDEVGGQVSHLCQGFGGQAGVPRTIRFGILCRFAEQKGIRYLLEAIKQYRDRYGDVHFTFAGQGELEPIIREFVDSSGLRNVQIIRVNSAPEILKDIDVFVHPSVDDAMPVSIAEALMCGCPCIVCRVGGVPDLVRDGVEGFLIKPGRADQIMDRMERFATMAEEEFIAFQKRARARYEEVCRPEKVGKVVADHYRAILKESE